MNPIYIVSGFTRSGLSMVMRCLEGGGLNPVVDQETSAELDKLHLNDPTYVSNPKGFYQTDIDKFISSDKNTYKNKVIKCYINQLKDLPVEEYKVVFIKRNPDDIKASLIAMGDSSEVKILDSYDELVESELKGFDTVILNYADIISNPEKEFQNLINWPIDSVVAASFIQSELTRLKLENI